MTDKIGCVQHDCDACKAAESALATLRAKYEAAEQGMPDEPVELGHAEDCQYLQGCREAGRDILHGHEDYHSCSCDRDARNQTKKRTYATALRSWAVATVAGLREDEKMLRHLLFLQHGSAEHYLYGDDGERHCNACMIDFNKDSPAEIERKICDYNLRKYAEAHPERVRQSPVAKSGKEGE